MESRSPAIEFYHASDVPSQPFDMVVRELGGVPQRSQGLKSAGIDILQFIGGISIEMVSRSLSEAKRSL
jgi:hypothetical protein